MDQKVLSFPCDVTNKVDHITITPETEVLCFDFPTNVLAPSFSTLSDGIDVNGYRSYSAIFGLFLNMCMCNFFVKSDEEVEEEEKGDEKKKKKSRSIDITEKFVQYGMSTLPAIELFMEYVCADDSTVDESMLVNNCVSIRFYFVFHGLGDMKISDPLATGVINTIKFNESSDQSKKSSKSVTVDKVHPHKFHTHIKTVSDFIRECKLYLGSGDLRESISMEYNNGFHPKSIFTMANCIKGNKSQIYDEVELAEGVFKFGVPFLVYNIPRCLWSPVSLFSVVLPRSISWREETRSARNVTINILTNRELLECFVNKQVNNDNVYREVTDSFDHLKGLLLADVKLSSVERKDKLDKLSMQFAKVLDRIFNPNIKISDENDSLVEFASTITSFSPTKEYTMIDSTLTPFANFMINYYFSLEYVFKIVSTHNLLHILLLSCLDAYRDEKNLHANLLIAGEAAAGKSHALDTISDIFIPGTVIKMGDFTEKSLTTSEKEFDKIVLFHESPPLFLGDNTMKGGPDTGSGILKDLLTSCEASFEQCFVDEGKRLLLRSKKERVGVHIIATNEPVHSIPIPMRSRMYVYDLHKVKKTYNTVGEYNKLEESEELKNNILQFKSQFIEIHRKCQLGVSFVNKLIRVGALNEPVLSACNGILNEFERYSKQITGGRTDDRYMSMIRCMIRSQVIYFAVYRFFTDQRDGGGYGLQISYLSFLPNGASNGIQPYLFATEEMAVFVVSLFVDNQCKQQSITVMEHFVNKILANEQNVVAVGKDHQITPEKTEKRGGVNWGMFKVNFIGRFSLVNQIHTTASQGAFELSKEQIESELNELSLGGVIDLTQIEQRIIMLNMDYMAKFLTYDKKDMKYTGGSGGITHMENMINNIADPNFASKRRVMSTFPIDNNHMNILHELKIKRDHKNIPTVTRSAYGGILNGAFVPIVREKLNEGREIDAYRMVFAGATQSDLDYYMYDHYYVPETPHFPEEYLLAAYKSVGIDYKNKPWAALLENYDNEGEATNKRRKLH